MIEWCDIDDDDDDGDDDDIDDDDKPLKHSFSQRLDLHLAAWA